MGLKVTTISRLPVATDRDYFIYFLDYGWDEPIVQALYANFERLASFAAEHRSLVITGLNRSEFANEVLSWHKVNGEDSADLLPAIMIADCDPRLLSQSNEFASQGFKNRKGVRPQRFVIIPLRKFCKSATDVITLLEQITADIKAKKPISHFEVNKVLDRTNEGLADVLVLRPSISGMGIDLKKAFEIGSRYFKKYLGRADTL
jgi:hypothetical protein